MCSSRVRGSVKLSGGVAHDVCGQNCQAIRYSCSDDPHRSAIVVSSSSDASAGACCFSHAANSGRPAIAASWLHTPPHAGHVSKGCGPLGWVSTGTRSPHLSHAALHAQPPAALANHSRIARGKSYRAGTEAQSMYGYSAHFSTSGPKKSPRLTRSKNAIVSGSSAVRNIHSAVRGNRCARSST